MTITTTPDWWERDVSAVEENSLGFCVACEAWRQRMLERFAEQENSTNRTNTADAISGKGQK